MNIILYNIYKVISRYIQSTYMNSRAKIVKIYKESKKKMSKHCSIQPKGKKKKLKTKFLKC